MINSYNNNNNINDNDTKLILTKYQKHQKHKCNILFFFF